MMFNTVSNSSDNYYYLLVSRRRIAYCGRGILVRKYYIKYY